MRDEVEISCDKLIASKYAQSAKRLKQYIESLLAQILDNKSYGQVTSLDLYTYNRYYDIVNKINEEIKILGGNEETILEDYLKGLYTENAKLLGKDFKLSTVDEAQMNKAVFDIWCEDGETWNQRIWTNQQLLALQLQDGIIDCITTGKSTKQLARTIAERYSVSLSYSQRLVRTEMTHVLNKSSADRYKEAGVQKYKVIGFKDKDTCEVCNKQQNKIYPMTDERNKEPAHPNCRCTIIPIIDKEESNV